MTLPLKLNRRHKVTLFLTLVLAGIAALSGVKMMEVAGISLLGLALAWAFGSDSRVVHWLFLSMGVLLECGIVGLAWYIHQGETNLYLKELAAFKRRIPELAKEYPLHNRETLMPPDDLTKIYAANKQQSLASQDDQDLERLAGPPSAPKTGGGQDQIILKQEWETATPLTKKPKPGDTTQGPEKPQLPAGFVPDGDQRGPWEDYQNDACLTLPGYFFDAPEETRKILGEACAAGVAIETIPYYELPHSPDPLWGLAYHDWQLGRVLVFGVFLFALGLGLILGIRSKPLPT